LLGIVLHTLFTLEEELNSLEERGCHSRRRFPEQNLNRISKVEAHDALLAGVVGATLAVAAVCQTIWKRNQMNL